MNKLSEKSSFSCDICKKKFTDRSNTNRHIRSVHNGKKYTCQWCKNNYTTKANLVNHLTGARTSKCEDIEKGIRNKQNVWETPSPEMDETPHTGHIQPSGSPERESVIELAKTSDHPQPQYFDTPCIATTGM